MPFVSKQKQREYQREYQRRRRRSLARDTASGEHRLSPVAKIGLAITGFLALALLSILAWFEAAGLLGQYIKTLFIMAFGWGALLFPVLLLGLALACWRGVRYQVNRYQLIGLILLFLALLGIMHHAPAFNDPVAAVAASRGGGYLGLAMSQPFLVLSGYWGAWVFLLVLLAMGALLTLSGVLFRKDEEPESPSWYSRLLEKYNTWRYARAYSTPSAEADEAELMDDPNAEAEKELAAILAESGADGEGRPEAPVEGKAAPLPKIRREIKIPLDLLESGKEKPDALDLEATGEKIQKTLATFGIPVEMGEVFVGPAITQYTLKPAEGVKLVRITSLANDLALALAAHPLRIEAPIPGKSLVGIEVPNRATAKVKLKDILQSSAFRHRASNLSICLGKDVAGKAWIVDLAKMPHLLIAGSTGSGKSVAINSLVVALMYQNSPDDLKFVLVDPKKVELVNYNDIPYLLTPVITDIKKTVNALKWVIGEMERRYLLLSARGKRNITVYNEANQHDPLPYIIFVIDELADLMSVAAGEVEGAIVRLAQMARAVGIHLVLATQRPSVNVLTGLIKANIPSRLAFSVPSQIDSRTILDTAGAEKLLGRGDMLFISPEVGKPRRLQGAFLADAEIERVVNFLKEQGGVEYAEFVVPEQRSLYNSEDNDASEDDLYHDAKAEVIRAGKASASLLQRRLRIGYARAARLLDLLEAEGMIGPADGAKPRDILVGDSNSEQYNEQ